MMRVEAAGATDTGQVRPANEDAYLVGESVFAVADGMGGHLAGEIASATALQPIQALDGHVYSDAAEAVTHLREAVVEANQRVSQLAADEPSYRGMGTTLTAAMVEGRRVHIAHVGDSRAYLLRGGSFSQLTDDHTLVQHLVDEGQITQEEAANHPQRSIITRAIGVSTEVEVDSMTLELEPGDQLLLCSDGLTGVIDDRRIAEEMLADGHGAEVLQRLIADANEAGGPDNITAILLRVAVDDAVTGDGDGDGRGDRSGDDTGRVVVTTRDEERPDDWARRLGTYGSLSHQQPGAVLSEPETRRPGRGRRIGAILVAVLLLAALIVGGAAFLLSQYYFVGLDGEEVVIYQGVDYELGPLDLARVVERTELEADDVVPWFRGRLEDGAPAASLEDARLIVDEAPRDEEADAPADDADPGAGDEATGEATGEAA